MASVEQVLSARADGSREKHTFPVLEDSAANINFLMIGLLWPDLFNDADGF